MIRLASIFGGTSAFGGLKHPGSYDSSCLPVIIKLRSLKNGFVNYDNGVKKNH
jgi:hypothetical protein